MADETTAENTAENATVEEPTAENAAAQESAAETDAAEGQTSDTDSTPVDDRDASGAGARRSRRGGLVVVALIVVALLAACGYLGYLVWQDAREDELRRTAAADASRLVVQLATYDHTDVDANIDAVTAEATPEFAERYREVSAGLTELLSSGEGTSTGTVSHAAVESVDADSAVVLVFLDQEITNVTVPEGRVDVSRMVVGLTRDGDRWLLDSAELA